MSAIIDNVINAKLTDDPHVASVTSLSGFHIAEITGAILYTLEVNVRPILNTEPALNLIQEEIVTYEYGINPILMSLPSIITSTVNPINRTITSVNGNTLTTSGTGNMNPGEYLEVDNKIYRVRSHTGNSISINQPLIKTLSNAIIKTNDDIRMKCICKGGYPNFDVRGVAQYGTFTYNEVK
jgi:hypothetical protein